MGRAVIFGPAAIAAVLACTPTEPRCLDICSVWTRVQGTVFSPSEEPVPGAEVQLRLMYDYQSGGPVFTCELLPNDEMVVLSTDAGGGFAALLHGLSIFPPDCVEVRVMPPEGAALMAHTDTILVGWSLEKDSAPVTSLSIVLMALPITGQVSVPRYQPLNRIVHSHWSLTQPDLRQ